MVSVSGLLRETGTAGIKLFIYDPLREAPPTGDDEKSANRTDTGLESTILWCIFFVGHNHDVRDEDALFCAFSDPRNVALLSLCQQKLKVSLTPCRQGWDQCQVKKNGANVVL